MLFETSLAPVPVFGLRRDMNRLFDEMLTRATPSSAWVPMVDVSESPKDIVLSAELPGVKREDVDVTFENGMLTIHGQKTGTQKKEDQEYHLVERSYGAFTRSFRLPKGVDESKIQAEFENGVLQVRIPKAALPQPKKIPIHGTTASSPAAVSSGTTAPEAPAK